MKANQRGIAHLYLIIVATVVIAAIGITGYLVSRHHNPVKATSPHAVATPGKATLQITSDPAGVQMTSINPACDDTKLHKVTPYTCVQTGKILDTVVTAPATAIINGKTYTFTTWDGCSASNKDKKICKVDVKKGQSKTLKATFVQLINSSKTRVTTSVSIPASTCNNAPQPSCTINTITELPKKLDVLQRYQHSGAGEFHSSAFQVSCSDSTACSIDSSWPVYNSIDGLPNDAFVTITKPTSVSISADSSDMSWGCNIGCMLNQYLDKSIYQTSTTDIAAGKDYVVTFWYNSTCAIKTNPDGPDDNYAQAKVLKDTPC